MSRRSSRPNLSGASHSASYSASRQKATTSPQASSHPKTPTSHSKTPTSHQKTSHPKPTTSRSYTVVVSAIKEEEEDEHKNEDIDSVSGELPSLIGIASKTTPSNATSTTSFSTSPVGGSDSFPAVATNITATNNNNNASNNNAATTGVDSLSDSSSPRRRGRIFSANDAIHASVGSASGGYPAWSMPTPPLRSYSSPEETVDSGTGGSGASLVFPCSPDMRNGDIWAVVHRQKQVSIDRWHKTISCSESVDSDMGSSIGSDAGSVTSSLSGHGKKEKSNCYEPHYQAAIASSVFNTLQDFKRANMDETAEAMHGSSEETKNNNNGLNPSAPGQHYQTGDITTKSNPVTAAVTGQQPSLSHPSSSAVTSHTLVTLTAEQIAQLQASIAYASLVPPSVAVGGGVGGDNSPAFFSHTPSVSESRNATRPSSNVTSARSTPPPQIHSQQQHPQQQHHHHLQPHQQLVAANVFTPVMLSMSKASSRRVSSSSSDDDDDDEYESEVLEESPCRRWQKRKETVMQNDIPGCDGSYLAMDTEEGFEVVWSELLFSERKKFKDQQEKIANIFDHLIQLDHPNIMKFHHFWMDNENTDQPRVIFIKEYMSSGSLAHFMRKSRMNKKKLQLRSWRRWSSEILSALSYLHDTRSRWYDIYGDFRYGDNGIIHGNLSCDTVFIQQNGTIKIGSVSLEAINHHVKTCRDQIDHRYFAPEYASVDSNQRQLTTAVDIYAFGVLALVMASAIQWPTDNGGSGVGGGGNGSGHRSTDEDGGNENQHSTELNESKLEASLGNDLQAAIERLENPLQQDFLRLCLLPSPKSRATAKELLAHPALTEGEANSLLILASSAAFEAIKGDSSDRDSVADFGLKIKTHIPPSDAVFASSSLHSQLSYFDVAPAVDLNDFAAKLISASPSSSSSSNKSEDDKETDCSGFVSPLRTLLRLRRRRCASGTAASTTGLNCSSGGAVAALSSITTINGATAEGSLVASGAHFIGGGGANGVEGGAGGDSQLTCLGSGAEGSGSVFLTAEEALERDSSVEGGGVLGLDGAEGTWEPETRTILQMSCSIQRVIVDDEEEEGEGGAEKGGDMWSLTLLFRLSDKMNRQLTAIIGSPVDTAPLLVEELVHYGFIAAEDHDRVTDFLAQNLQNRTAYHRHSSVDSFVEDPNSATPK